MHKTSETSDVRKTVEELVEAAKPVPSGSLSDVCISNEELLNIMQGDLSGLSNPALEAHLKTCRDCSEHVEHARQSQKDYERRKQEFLSTIPMGRPRPASGQWIRVLNPLRAAARPNLAWASVAIAAAVLALLPFVFAPQQDDPTMVRALKRIAGLPVEDVNSAQQMAAQLKSDTMKGAHTEPIQMSKLKSDVEKKRDQAGDNEKLKRGWVTVFNDVHTAQLLNQYEINATASGSPDLLQNLDMKEAQVEEDGTAVFRISRDPQNIPFTRTLLERANNDEVGFEKVTVKRPNDSIVLSFTKNKF